MMLKQGLSNMNKNRLIDFHCHLDLFENYQDLITECETKGIRTLSVTTTPRAWKRNYELTKNTKYVRAALGLHPQLIQTDSSEELRLWDQYFHEAKYIGEVGIDAGPNFSQTLAEQQKVFKHILKSCAQAGDKILSVHSVRSASLVLDHIEDLLPQNRGSIVLHWFTGTLSEAKRAIKLGCYFSINTAMLRTKKGQQLVRLIPIERVLTETDGPFIEWNNRPSTPADVENAIALLAKIVNQTSESLSDAILLNLKALTKKSNTSP